MWPKFRSFSTSSKAISPLYILLKICSASLKPIKLIGALSPVKL